MIGDIDLDVFSFPKWKREQPGWSFTFAVGDNGPSVLVSFGGEDVVDFQTPWDNFALYVPMLWPFLAMEAMAIGYSE